MLTPNPYIGRKEAARYLTSIGCPIHWRTLANMACGDSPTKGPVFYKTAWGRVYYLKNDLTEWAKNQVKRIE